MRKIAAAAVTKTGRRLNNQDNFMLDGVAAPQNHNTFAYETKYDLNQPFLATLCDGMGGESSGERASFEACSELANICESLSQNMQENKELLNHTILRSNDRLCSIMRNEETGRMGSTIISVLIQNETLYYTNLGDSRIYLLRNGKLKQITKDHTEGQRMVDAGILTPEQLKTHHSRNKLNRHLGIFPEEMQIECEEYEDIKLQRGDKLLLCSDGVFGVLEDQTMVSILSEKKSVKARAEKLVDTAFSNGSKDNMTAVVIDYDNSVPVILPILAVAAALTVITATVLVVCLTHSPELPQPSESNAESSGQSDFSTPAINPSSSAEHSEPSNFESENIDESSYSVDESSYSVDESSYSVDESGDQEPSANQESSYDASLDDPEPVSDESVHESTVSVTSVRLIPTSPFLKVGESKTLQADVNPQNATNKNVKWNSSNPEVVAVDTNGKITAIKEGKATITVTTSDGNKTATCTIEVKSDRVMVNKISIDPTNLELEIGGKDSHKLNVKFVPEDATNKNVKWETTDPSVAIVDPNGVVTAKNPGTAQITATAIDGEAFSSCRVNVRVKVSDIKLNKENLSLLVGDYENLEYSIIPNNATNKDVTWHSNNSSVAKVDSNGNVTAIKEGTATITVTTDDGSKTASCVVTVTKKDDTSGGDTSGDNSSTDDVSGDDNSGGESSEGEHSDGKDTGEDNDSSSEHGGHKPHNE